MRLETNNRPLFRTGLLEKIEKKSKNYEFPDYIRTTPGKIISDNFLNLKVYNTPESNLIKETSSGSDTIIVDQGVVLPEGMTTADIQDALNQARDFEGQNIRFIAFVREKIEIKGRTVGGVSRGPVSSGWYLELSASAARISAMDSSFLPGYISAPASEQMWAYAFEEALHAAREAAGKDKDPYFRPPAKPSIDDTVRYLLQEAEAAVDKALNSGILETKFGKGRVYLLKRVLRKIPASDYLSNFGCIGNTYLSNTVLQSSVSRIIDKLGSKD